MDNRFQLSAHGTSASKEALCGVTAFLTMSYILFVNPAIVSASGMPVGGIFTATVLAAAICSIIMGLFANSPFGMAPGMTLNTFFTYTVCAKFGFHWKEALALVFLTGILHLLIMETRLRKTLVNALPQHLRMAFGVGLGIFIGYTGLKGGGFLAFTTPPSQYVILEGGTVLSNSATIPSFVSALSATQIIAIIGLAVVIALLALEKKTGETYAALPVAILTGTFVGIPLNVTLLVGVDFFDISPVMEIGQVFFAFLGDPGLLSILADPGKLLFSGLSILILLTVNIVDSIGTIVGIGQAQNFFSDKDMEAFSRRDRTSKLDKAFACNALGGSIGATLGTTTVTTYMESITGIMAGGRTGLTSVTIGCMFLICLPLTNFFSIIPPAAVAPALIAAGAFMIPLVTRINWHNFEEAFPAFITILCIPLTYSFIYGIAAGVLSHIIIQVAIGNWRDIHPMLYTIASIFIAIITAETLL